MFYDAYFEFIGDKLEYKNIIGIYKPDFMLSHNIIIEIDGHEYHKTKEQRESDYIRERYFQKKGYKIIRFTGTEVFLDAEKCVNDAFKIAGVYDNEIIDAYESRGRIKNGIL